MVMDLMLGEIFSTVIKLFALLTPPAVLSAFLSGTQRYGRRRKMRTALRTGSAVFIMGSILYFFGESLFAVFGFTLDAFRIGSGILLFLNGLSIMNPPDTSTNQTHDDEDISIVPLALPITLGPASIGTLMVMGASADNMSVKLFGLASFFCATLLITLMLMAADHVQRILGHTGMAVLAKLTGLLLAALAAQVVFTGVKNFLYT